MDDKSAHWLRVVGVIVGAVAGAVGTIWSPVWLWIKLILMGVIVVAAAAVLRAESWNSQDRERREREVDKKRDAQHAELVALWSARAAEAKVEAPGPIKEAMQLSADMYRFASDWRIVEPVQNKPFASKALLSESADYRAGFRNAELEREMDLSQEQKRFQTHFVRVYERDFRTRVTDISAAFVKGGLNYDKLVKPICREPRDLYDVTIIAEYIYGNAKTLRDCIAHGEAAPRVWD